MSSTDALAASAVSPAGDRSGPALQATAVASWAEAEGRWDRLSATGDALAFQRTAWVGAWYRHCIGAGVEPCVVFLGDGRTGTDLLALALVRLRKGARRVIAFADGGLTDYNGPLLGRACPDGLGGRSLARALLRALPPADVLRLEKMPVLIGDRPNPLAGLPGVAPSKFTGHVLSIPGTWDDWLAGQDRHFRKELGRCRRVFERNAGAAFRRYGPGPEAARVYDGLQALQRARIADLGLPYILDDEPARGFYDTIVREGLRDGTAVLSALTIGDEVVAALLGVTDGRHFAMTRLATPGPQWGNFSPGRLVIERTMQALHAEGYRSFDFTIGDYPYKRRIGASPVAMVELRRALTPFGLPEVLRVRLRSWARRQTVLRRWIERRRAGYAGVA